MRRTISEGIQQINAAMLEIERENAVLREENEQLRKVPSKWRDVCMINILRERDQLANKVKAVEEELKNTQESREELLEQLKVLINIYANVRPSDGERV